MATRSCAICSSSSGTKTYRPSGLRPVLEHYDYTIGQWYARVDKVRSAQRQWSELRTLPAASELGIPAVGDDCRCVPATSPAAPAGTAPAATPSDRSGTGAGYTAQSLAGDRCWLILVVALRALAALQLAGTHSAARVRSCAGCGVPGGDHAVWIAVSEAAGGGAADRSLRSYFLANNTIPWWAIALSIVSAETSTLTIISIPGVAFAGDFGFLQVVIGYMIGRMVVAGLFLPKLLCGGDADGVPVD